MLGIGYWLLQLQGVFAPSIDQADSKNREEQKGFEKREKPNLVVGYRPGEKENGLNVENDKDQGIDKILGAKLNPGIAEGLEAALKGVGLDWIGFFGPQQVCQPQSDKGKDKHNDHKDPDKAIV
jgi:hypothetical protein